MSNMPTTTKKTRFAGDWNPKKLAKKNAICGNKPRITSKRENIIQNNESSIRIRFARTDRIIIVRMAIAPNMSSNLCDIGIFFLSETLE